MLVPHKAGTQKRTRFQKNQGLYKEENLQKQADKNRGLRQGQVIKTEKSQTEKADIRRKAGALVCRE